EELSIGADGSEDTVSFLQSNSVFGEISIICNIPQPYTIRVCEVCRLLRIDKQSFSNILEVYFHDGRKVLTNLLEGKKSNLCMKQLESDITFHIRKQEAELALRVNCAAYYGDLFQLKSLIRSGADPNMKDYDGRSALHLAASRGHEDIVLFLIQEDADINVEDNFGNTPLLEAIKGRHDKVASLLLRERALLKIDNPAGYLCTMVSEGDTDLLRRVFSKDVGPNSKDYDPQTPLHIAASQGSYLMEKLLLEAGANVFLKDRYLYLKWHLKRC
ncbi:UNVERIFIED_CONTAM: Potassium channel SKOR, partial [Sesamum radiatum]